MAAARAAAARRRAAAHGVDPSARHYRGASVEGESYAMIYQQRLATHLYIVIVVVASSLAPAPAAIAGGPCTCREQRYCAPLST